MQRAAARVLNILCGSDRGASAGATAQKHACSVWTRRRLLGEAAVLVPGSTAGLLEIVTAANLARVRVRVRV